MTLWMLALYVVLVPSGFRRVIVSLQKVPKITSEEHIRSSHVDTPQSWFKVGVQRKWLGPSAHRGPGGKKLDLTTTTKVVKSPTQKRMNNKLKNKFLNQRLLTKKLLNPKAKQHLKSKDPTWHLHLMWLLKKMSQMLKKCPPNWTRPLWMP